jgi:hypothetical protein
MSRSCMVILKCGHWFFELRPSLLFEAMDYELRVCADPQHYPELYPAVYVSVEPEFIQEYYVKTESK